MNRTLKLVIIYTILFAIIAAGVFYHFLINHVSFIQYGDGYRRGYFWLVENKGNLETFLSGGGLTNWSWSKGLGMETSFITDPFTILAASFEPENLELGYTVALVVELYFCGLAFLAFAREVGMTDLQCILGAICYAFCGWGIDSALVQYSFVLKLVLFPILILSVDRIYKGKSPILFILTVAYYTITGVYFAYMAALGVILYILFRYAYYHDRFKLGEYLLTLGRFVIYGIIGLAISAITSLPYVYSLMSSTTESATDGYGLFYAAEEYFYFGKHFISQAVTGGFSGGYSYLGLSVIVLMAVPVAFRHFSMKSTPAIMTIICGIMLTFPFFSSALNGFSYCSSRWYFMVAFFLLWAGLTNFVPSKLAETKNLMLMMAALFVMFVWTIVFGQIGVIAPLDDDETLFIMLNLFSGLLALLIILISGRKGRDGWRSVCIAGICTAAIISCWFVAFSDHTSNYLRNHEIYNQLQGSTQRVSNQIQDDGFYRTDQVNGIRNNRLLNKPANENLWWKSRTLYIYDSKIPADMIKLNGLVGNNYGYAERVYMLSNDNRMGLDFLMGVKYFLGKDVIGQHFTPDYFAGYGFKESGTIDGVTIWKNKYDTGLGFGYDAFISESEFNKLSRLEREQALLQTAVIPDEEAGSLSNCREVMASDIETKIVKPKFTIKAGKNAVLEDGKITATDVDAELKITPTDVPAGQLILSFDGLNRLYSDGSGGNSLRMYVSDSKIEKSNVRVNNNQALKDVDHYDINLGYSKKYEDTITVRFSEAGTYTFDDIYLSSMSASLYDKYAAQRIKSRYDISSFDDKTVTGTVEMQKDGILYFSIYDYDNWDVYVDGKRVEKLDRVNIAFTGVELSHGTHQIVLKYSFRVMKTAMMVTSAGLLAALIVCIIHLLGRTRRQSEDTDYETGQHS